MKSTITLLILFFALPLMVFGQLKLGDNEETIDPASLLELESSSLVFVMTRVTTAEMNGITPLQGAMVYNTDTETIHYYDGAEWLSLGEFNSEGNNLFLGSGSGTNTTTGEFNVGLGINALAANTEGLRNTAVGFAALEASEANNNTSFGFRALSNNVSGGNNSAFGLRSMQDNTSGNRNSGFGRYSLKNLRTGNGNSAVGYNAGSLIGDASPMTSATNSVFIGDEARAKDNDESNQIVIGANLVGNGANTVSIGNVNITDNFFNGNIDITGEYRVNGVPIEGGGGGSDVDFGQANVFVGSGAGENTAEDATGRENVAVGFAALGSNTTGIRNTAMGTEALFFNVTGEGNTAVGNSALVNNTSNGNSAFGIRALQNNTEGRRNAAFGNAALVNLNTGIDNIAMGTLSGFESSDGSTLTSADDSIFIGHNTRANANGQVNQVVIGSFARGNGSNTVTIGNGAITDNYFNGDIHADGFRLNALQDPPASASDTGTTGEIRIDANFIYVCVATNTWVRAPLSSW